MHELPRIPEMSAATRMYVIFAIKRLCPSFKMPATHQASATRAALLRLAAIDVEAAQAVANLREHADVALHLTVVALKQPVPQEARAIDRDLPYEAPVMLV